jgi:hypothetical protein
MLRPSEPGIRWPGSRPSFRCPLRRDTRRPNVATPGATLDGPKDERTRFVAVLGIPPVESAETAWRAFRS